ncbi:MAG TPA: nucleotidyl transferase AbiEii/AbiGii toxin family protein [Vicinamibacterales bacterium]|nr:nucleotidyl transferase AbiEii/AbiGii toxin family protein [Vicinamibacterales bacterium]
MTPLEAALRGVHQALTNAGASCALIGDLAVSAHTEPRFTRDADLAVATDEEAEALVRRLQTSGYGVQSAVEQKAVNRLATVRLSRPDGRHAPVIDLLFASSGIEREVVEAAEPVELLQQFWIRVARIGHLIALKILSRDDESRPQDLVDLRALLRVATSDELAMARRALQHIEARGYHRGRDLMADFETLLRHRAGD